MQEVRGVSVVVVVVVVVVVSNRKMEGEKLS